MTGPDRDEVFQWDPTEPELMREMIKAGVQIQMPITTLEDKVNEYFTVALERVVEAGYGGEILYVRDLPRFPSGGAEQFFEQYVWCVLNAGMKEQIARKIWERYLNLLNPDVIGHLGKRKAIIEGSNEYVRWFGELKCSKDPIEYLQTLPWIGPITKYHLARNIGIDAVKPDRHLIRLAEHFGYPSPYKMCVAIQKRHPQERLGTIDVILWRDCNLGGSP